MSVNFQQLAPIFAVCMGASSVLINYGSYSQTLKSLELKVEAQEKKVNSVDIITNELTHLQGSLDELKVNIKNEFADYEITRKKYHINLPVADSNNSKEGEKNDG